MIDMHSYKYIMHFLLAGDSWSQGEWYNNDVTHKGLEQYILDSRHDVTNVGRGGIDNCEALYQVERALWPGIDHLIFFHTDVLRSCLAIDLRLNLPMDMLKKYQAWTADLLDRIKKNNSNLKITVIGGCGKFNTESTSAWNYCVPSLTELLVPGYSDTEFWASQTWIRFINEHASGELSGEHKSQILKIEDAIESKKKCWLDNKDFFYPDGTHPNRHAHKLLFEHLTKLWNLHAI